MKSKIVIGILVLFIFISLFRGSYAKNEDKSIELDLYDNSNIEMVKEDLVDFIDLVDGNIITNSSFNLSSKLNENYDFLTKFVISFILDNEEYFDVIYGDEYVYIDEYDREYVSNKYINIDLLYDITYKIFGVEYYYILDEDLIINDNMVLLVDLDNDFSMEIDKITNIVRGSNYYDVYVKYVDYDIDYIYRFDMIDNNRLVISNLSIGE